MLADQNQARARKHSTVTTDIAAAFDESIVLAVPKGRILKELRPVLNRIGIVPSAPSSGEFGT